MHVQQWHRHRRLRFAAVYNGTTVTITMKGWKWSNGETVTAQDVLFWIHMQQAVGAQDWFDFAPGLFPSNISDVKAVSSTKLTMKMNKPYNTTWFTYNPYMTTQLPYIWPPNAPFELSEIADNLRGVLPQNPTGQLNPEDWYFVK